VPSVAAIGPTVKAEDSDPSCRLSATPIFRNDLFHPLFADASSTLLGKDIPSHGWALATTATIRQNVRDLPAIIAFVARDLPWAVYGASLQLESVMYCSAVGIHIMLAASSDAPVVRDTHWIGSW
jgi:hypothetical protein